MSGQMEGARRSGLRCDRCGLEALAKAPIDQPLFHLFEDGVLCDDCYRRTLDRGTPPRIRDDV